MNVSRTAILAHRVLTGPDLKEQLNRCVLVDNGKILDILPAEEYRKLKDTWPAVDLGRGTLMPGLFDCHSHLALDAGRKGHLAMMSLPEEEHMKLAEENLKKDLYSGVTTMRCMGDRYYLDIRTRELIRRGSMEGPDILVCGIGMRSAAGHGYVGLPHTGAEEFAVTSRENIRRGADHLKVFISPGIPAASPEEEIPCFLTREEIRAVIREAREAGIHTTAHCIGGNGLDICVQEGIDVIDHLYSVTLRQVQLLETSFSGWVDLTSGIVLDEKRENYTPVGQNERMRAARPYSRQCLRRIYRSDKIRYTLGTDAYHGMLYREVEFAVSLGADRRQALLAVTSDAARMTGLERVRGQIAPGYQADLAGFGQNPLTQENALADVKFVMKQGRIISFSKKS